MEVSGLIPERQFAGRFFFGIYANPILFPPRYQVTIDSSLASILFPFHKRSGFTLEFSTFIPNPRVARLHLFPYVRSEKYFEDLPTSPIHYFVFSIKNRVGILNKVYSTIAPLEGDIRASYSWVVHDQSEGDIRGKGLINIVVDFSNAVPNQARLFAQHPDYKGPRRLHDLFTQILLNELGADLIEWGYRHGPMGPSLLVPIKFNRTVRIDLRDLVRGRSRGVNRIQIDKEFIDLMQRTLSCGYGSCLYSFNLREQLLDLHFFGGSTLLSKFQFRLIDNPHSLKQASSVLAKMDVDIAAEFWGGIPREEEAYWTVYADIMRVDETQNYATLMQKEIEEGTEMHRKEVRKIKERLSKSIYDKVKVTLDSMTFPEPKMIRDFKVDII